MTALYRFYASYTQRGGDHDEIAIWAESYQKALESDRLWMHPTSRVSPGFLVDPIPDACKLPDGTVCLLTPDQKQQFQQGLTDGPPIQH